MASKKRSKRIPKAQAEAIARHVKAHIEDVYGGVQRAAERGMGISQSHLSALMRPEDRRGPGLDVLLRLREKLRISLDELLDLPPLGGRVPQEEIAAQVRVALVELVRDSRALEGEEIAPMLPPAPSKRS